MNVGAVIVDDYLKILNLDLLLGTQLAALEINPITSSNTQANELTPNTVTGKGFFLLKDYPAVRFEFQMVGKAAQVQSKGEW